MSAEQPPQEPSAIDFGAVNFENAFLFVRPIAAGLVQAQVDSSGHTSILSKLESVTSTQWDHEFSKLTGEQAKQRSRIIDFIEARLDPVTSLSEAHGTILATAQRLYIERLRLGATTSSRAFQGFCATVEGKRHDFTVGDAAGVYSNIRVINTMNAYKSPSIRYIEWGSQSYVEKRQSRIATPFARRIYLNPRHEAAVDVFEKLTSQLSGGGVGLVIKARLLERQNHMNRGDGIVVAAQGSTGSEVLNIVKQVYVDSRDVFRGQPIVRVAMKIADGFAIGDEPLEDVGDVADPLTVHRGLALDEAFTETREDLRGVKFKSSADRKKEILSRFQLVWHDIASSHHIDPNNFAFNKPKQPQVVGHTSKTPVQ